MLLLMLRYQVTTGFSFAVKVYFYEPLRLSKLAGSDRVVNDILRVIVVHECRFRCKRADTQGKVMEVRSALECYKHQSLRGEC